MNSSTGEATCAFTYSSLSGSPHSIVANYSDSGGQYLSSSSSTLTQTVSKASTATAVTGNGSTVSGQSVTFTATVSASSPGSGNPTGNVEFFATPNGGTQTPISGCTSQGLTGTSTDTATCTTSSLVASGGPYTIAATYAGDSGYLTSTSSAVAQAVSKASTTTATSTDLSSYVSGQTITVSATVAPVSPGTGTPTGTVSVSDGDGRGCTITLAAGAGNCTLSETPGNYTMSGTYSGDSDFSSSNASAPTMTVSKASTGTATSTDLSSYVSGQTVTVSATVTAVSPGTGTPTGTVSVSDGNGHGCTITLAAGAGNCTLSETPGNYTMSGTYSGDSDFSSSNGSAAAITVSKASTRVGLTSSIDPTVSGQFTTWTATLTVASPGSDAAAVPTGTITFEQSPDGVHWATACAAQPISWNSTTHKASVTCNLEYDASSSGVRVMGIYSGDGDFDNATSTPVAQTVDKASTSTSVSSGTDPTVSGQATTWTATVTVDSPGTTDLADPTVGVGFEQSADGGKTWTSTSAPTNCSDQPLTWSGIAHDSTATCTQTYNAASSGVEVRAVYLGDTNFSGSTSSAQTQLVNPASTFTQLVSSQHPTVSGQPMIWTATIGIVSPGTASVAPPGGTVTLQQMLPGASSYSPLSGCTNIPVHWVSSSQVDTASCDQGYTVAQSGVQVEAVYSGDTNFDPSTSGPITQTVNPSSTTTILTSGTDPTVSGQATVWTAAVTVNAPGSDRPITPGGNVVFAESTDNGSTWTPISGCAAQAPTWGPTTGTATCSQAYNQSQNGIEVEASYLGDATNGFAASQSLPVTQTVNTASTQTAITASVNPSVSGRTVTWTAAVTISSPGSNAAGDPTGYVEFDQSTDGGQTWNAISNPAACGQATLTWQASGGSASCQQAYDTASNGVEVRANYVTGDSNFAGSTSGGVTEATNRASTNIGVTPSANPSVSGQTVTWVADLAVAQPGSDSPTAPTGTVTFQQSVDSGGTWTDISSCTAKPITWVSGQGGSATCDQAYDTASSGVEVQALYSGDSNFTPSSSSTVTETVGPAATTISVISGTNPSVSGQATTWTATLNVNAPGSDAAATPSGTVGFVESPDGVHWTTACPAQTLTWDATAHTATVTCDQNYAADSDGVQVEAVYSGDADFNPFTSDPATQTVNPADTSTALQSSVTPSVSGQDVTWTATVAVTAPGSDDVVSPTGAVEFSQSSDGGGTWSAIAGCEAQSLTWSTTDHSGSATCELPYAASSDGVEVRAAYTSGDSNFNSSTSTAVTQNVDQASTVSAIASDTNPSVSGQTTDWMATVTIVSPGSDQPAIPGGVVDLEQSTDNGSTWSDIPGCGAQPVTWAGTLHQGGAGCDNQTYSASQSGIEVEAVYSGDGNFSNSTSPASPQTVLPASTVTSVSSDPSSTVSGQSTTWTAKVGVSAPGAGSPAAPTGTVEFEGSSDGGSSWSPIEGCTAQTIVSGSATCEQAYLATANGAEVEGVYSGDTNFLTSTSAASEPQTVTPASTTGALSAERTSTVTGQPLSLLDTVTLTDPGSDSAGLPTGSVAFQQSSDNGSDWSNIAGCATESLDWSVDTHQGTASCSTAYDSAAGTGYLVRAVYSGDSSFSGSTTLPTGISVSPDATSTAVWSNHPSSVPGAPIRFTAWVTASKPGAASPTGTVQFWDGNTVLCAASQIVDGVATCTVHLPVQPLQQTVGVIYSGSASLQASAGSMVQSILHGYWLVASNGSVRSFGQAKDYGSADGLKLKKPMVGMAATPDGKGYWLVASDGGLFAYGDAGFYGSTGRVHLVKPIVSIVPTADGEGYYMVASDGGVFAFGKAAFYGSAASYKLDGPIVGMVLSPTGKGYYLVGSDGGVFAFGDAHFHGSGHGSVPAGTRAVGLAPTPDLGGYWLALSSGKVVCFGTAKNMGSTGRLGSPATAITATGDGGGYWITVANGTLYSFGDAIFDGWMNNLPRGASLMGMADL